MAGCDHALGARRSPRELRRRGRWWGMSARSRLLMTAVHSHKPAGAQHVALGHARALAGDQDLVAARRTGGSVAADPALMPR
jgi:hypothetical protein